MMINYTALMTNEFFLAELDRVLEDRALETAFNIPDLCKILAMSRTSLHRKITHSAGMSISIYVRIFRLKKAYEKLKGGAKNISEVAYQVGFSDLAYFSNCFKAYYSFPPSQLLEEVRLNRLKRLK